jgi:hypothetical protein
MKISARLTIATLLLLGSFTAGAVPAGALADAAKVEWQWGVKIPLRDARHRVLACMQSASAEPSKRNMHWRNSASSDRRLTRSAK